MPWDSRAHVVDPSLGKIVRRSLKSNLVCQAGIVSNWKHNRVSHCYLAKPMQRNLQRWDKHVERIWELASLLCKDNLPLFYAVLARGTPEGDWIEVHELLQECPKLELQVFVGLRFSCDWSVFQITSIYVCTIPWHICISKSNAIESLPQTAAQCHFGQRTVEWRLLGPNGMNSGPLTVRGM